MSVNGCTICLNDSPVRPVKLTNCTHSFCSRCIIKWHDRYPKTLDAQFNDGAYQALCPNCRVLFMEVSPSDIDIDYELDRIVGSYRYGKYVKYAVRWANGHISSMTGDDIKTFGLSQLKEDWVKLLNCRRKQKERDSKRRTHISELED